MSSFRLLNDRQIVTTSDIEGEMKYMPLWSRYIFSVWMGFQR